MRRMAGGSRLAMAVVAVLALAPLAVARASESEAGAAVPSIEPPTAAPADPRVTDPADSTGPLPPVEAKRLRAALRSAVAAVPGAAPPYRLDREYNEEHVFAAAKASRRPGMAVAERYYEVPEGTPKTALPLGEEGLAGPVEVTIAVNAPIVLPNLTSVASDTARFVLSGAEAALVASLPPRVMEGRLAAMRPEEAKYRLASIYIVVGGPVLDAAMRNVATGADLGALDRVPIRPARRAGDARWVTIRIHGPLAVVERAAKGVNTRALRKLLSP